MRLEHLSLVDFRNYVSAELQCAPGLTAVVGANGEGKSNLLEAVAYLATLSSFRGAPPEALVRQGCERAVIRGEGERDGRRLQIEIELQPGGRDRAQVNRQPLRRSRDLLGNLRATVFSPDDLTLVKGGPAERRRYLDDTLVALHPRNDALRRDVDRVLRQRNTLLKQARGRLTDDVATTLDVWDEQFVAAGEALAQARWELASRLEPTVAKAYDDLAGDGAASREQGVMLAYDAAWTTAGLGPALAASRADDLRRGVTTVGPHRDDLSLWVGGLPARTHRSQGEQRTLALALRLASHEVVADTAGSTPVLLLDDVFSELDPGRSAALLRHLPPGQALLSTAGPLPPAAQPERVVRVRDGVLD